MSLEILEKVKDFLIRLVKDESFRAQLMSEKVEEVRKVMADSSYNFSQEEFETAAIQILDLKESGEFHELSEEELVGAVGGLTTNKIYWQRPCKWCPKPKPIDPQPLYGVVIEPIEPIDPIKPPIIQPMYGVIVATDS